MLATVLIGTYGCGGRSVEPGKVVETPNVDAAATVAIADSNVCRTIADFPYVKDRGVSLNGTQWNQGQTLRIRFINGTATQKQWILDGFDEWEKYANLKDTVVTTGNSDIRVSFSNSGNWSHIGTGAKYVSQNAATMNVTYQGSVFHEIGHAIGLAHEAASPNSTLCYNKPVIDAYLKGGPNFWDQATIDANVYFKYNPSAVNASIYDVKSIMGYSWSDKYLIYDPPSCPIKSVPQNTVLSETDKWFIGTIYPKVNNPPPPPPGNVTITTAQKNNIKRITSKVTAANNAAKLASDSLNIIINQIFQ